MVEPTVPMAKVTLARFLLGAIQLGGSRDQFHSTIMEPFGGGLPEGTARMPIPGPSDAVRRLDNRSIVDQALASELDQYALPARDAVADLPEAPRLVSNLGYLRRVMDMAAASDLGGIPLFRDKTVTGEVLPLYDFTDAGNIAELTILSKVSLPSGFGVSLDATEAALLKAAMQADPRIEIEEDTDKAMLGVLRLYAADIEEVAKLQSAPPQPPSAGSPPPPGHVRLTFDAQTADIAVGHRPHAVKKTLTPMPNITDSIGRTTGIMHTGTYAFGTPDLNKPHGIEDTRPLGVWSYQTHLSTNVF